MTSESVCAGWRVQEQPVTGAASCPSRSGKWYVTMVILMMVSMKRMIFMKTTMRVAMLLGVLIAGAVAPLHASVVTYPLDYIFSPPTGTVSPLGTVVLTD